MVIEIKSLTTRFGSQVVHDSIDLSINRGQIVAIIGASGTGKSTLLREIIRLQKPYDGCIELLGTDVWATSDEAFSALRARFGVLFQHGALFSALTSGENIALPLREETSLSLESLKDIVQLRLGLVGLEPEVAQKMPSELSGGMRKRVALARALALEPELLFLDEPTSGLDPLSARKFDHLIRTLCDSLGLTIFMVTHDLASLKGGVDRIIVLDSGKIIGDGHYDEVSELNHPWIHEYFHGPSFVT